MLTIYLTLQPQPLKAKEASSTPTAIQSIPSTASVLLRSPAHPAGPQPSTPAPILPPRSRKFASLQTDHLPPASPKTGTPLESALPISGVGVAGPSQSGPSHQTHKPSRLPSARLNLRSGAKQQQRSPASAWKTTTVVDGDLSGSDLSALSESD